MKVFWGFLLRLLLLALAGLALGWWLGPVTALALMCGVLLIDQALHLWHLRRLRRWLWATDTSRLPEETGLWGDIFVDLYRMQKRHARDRDQLAAALNHFREAASALPEGVMLLDGEGRIEWLNAMAQRQFDLDPQRDQGTLVTHLIRQPDFAEYVKTKERREPLMLRLGTSPARDLALQLFPFESGCLLYSRDVTQLQRVETVRRDFIANVSHELRTPLTVILGFLEPLTEDEALAAESRVQYLAMIQDQARRMSRLVEDLLTLSKLEAQAEPLQEEVVDMPALLNALLDEGRALSGGRHEFAAEIDDLALMGSASELRSAFGNLISNAVRYTPEGGRIALRWGRQGAGALFEVSDNGIGIAAEHVPRLTERFYRVDKGRSARTGGTGLGLAIVKYVLLRHQARLEIRSELGRGSCFQVVFPPGRALAA